MLEVISSLAFFFFSKTICQSHLPEGTLPLCCETTQQISRQFWPNAVKAEHTMLKLKNFSFDFQRL